MIGVIIVTFRSADVIVGCLDSLKKSNHFNLRIVVCDNNSSDQTVDVIRDWAVQNALHLAEATPASEDNQGTVTLLHTGGNLGFAGGVNAGLSFLLKDPDIDLFWILNPDCEALPDTAEHYARCASETESFSIMGGRIFHHEPCPRRIQSDGGRISRWSGICHNVNSGKLEDEAAFPSAEEIDYISGANMLVSRDFIHQVGLLEENYFLYYEEVDWAVRRGTLSLVLCPEARVLHHGGTSIGSGTLARRPNPFSEYFNNRNRMRFMRRFRYMALPVSWLISMSRVGKLILIGSWHEAWAAFCGLNGLTPPREIRSTIAPEDQKRAFSKTRIH